MESAPTPQPPQQPKVEPPAPAGSPEAKLRAARKPAVPGILATMKADGSRITLHPSDVRGRWITWRRAVFAALIAFYVVTPLIQIGGHPAMHLDVEHRRFYLFGSTFNAQDFWMVLLLALSFAFSLLFVTTWRGRVWCGWACPQTVFLEGVYRPIERLIDGPREHRLRDAQAPWTLKKVLRTALKHFLFFFVSLNIAHAAAAIFVSPREFLAMILEGPALHLEAFILVMGFTAILTFNFIWFREQFCIVVCPYGRLQSVLYDDETVAIAYDEKRGEPRGKLLKNPPPGAPKLGDCIDCKRCVQACPTGIDIRDGLQMECLACHQCIDACDEVMTKIGRPKELISYSSQAAQKGQPSRVMRPRLMVYAALTLLSLGTLGVSLALRTPFESNLLRARGATPFIVDGAVVRNPFELHLVNKNPVPSKFHIEISSPVPAEIVLTSPYIELASLADVRVPVLVSIPRASLTRPVELTVKITDSTSGVVKRQPVRFLAP